MNLSAATIDNSDHSNTNFGDISSIVRGQDKCLTRSRDTGTRFRAAGPNINFTAFHSTPGIPPMQTERKMPPSQPIASGRLANKLKTYEEINMPYLNTKAFIRTGIDAFFSA
jgi:hypothetical protein